MHFVIGSLLAASIVVTGANDANKIDSVYNSWEQSQRGLQSLIVEFSREVRDPIFQTVDKADGVFRLVHTSNGEVYASLKLGPQNAHGEKVKRSAGDPRSRIVYRLDYKRKIISVLDYDRKTEFHLKLAEMDPLILIGNYFCPLTVLLDRTNAKANCFLEIKQDESYTYLSAKPKHKKQRTGWFGPIDFNQSRVVLMNTNSPSIPKGMPRQLWMDIGTQEITCHIKTWRTNAADGPRVEEFTDSEKRPGWRVDMGEWPLKSTGAPKMN